MSRTAEQIAVMQASLEGKPIESRPHFPEDGNDRGEWRQTPQPSWNWNDYDYRVKTDPIEPRTFKAWVFKEEPILYPQRLSGLTNRSGEGWQEITVIEQLPGWKLVPPVAGLAPVAPDTIVDLMLAETFSSGVTLGASKVKQVCDHIRALHAANFATP